MTYRVLMVSRMDPSSADTVAKLFGEHDETDLPHEFGVSSRTLFHYQGMTMHLIQADKDIFDNLPGLHGSPAFQKLNRALAAHMSPLVTDWQGIADSRAREFYHRSWI
ncbi:TcmI family type II polyketide cyclase [Streptomonospora sp. PA3]|uniref:TcmI family type II polyketide cyclase n=1 Tax=Streptomonospora sp. PA3 TaxID=2607326 RepID=UPI0012DEE975|nr:TcmI family type II polyketide cyclase [Streptomonospora sp. PA3]MUL41475.1 TcmI family type II polyketide cyclase [Streptomonospora sp. PA3]